MTYPTPPQGPQRSPLSSPAVLLAIIAGVLLLIGGVAVAFVYANDKKSDEQAAAASSSAAESSQAENSPEQSTPEESTPETADPGPVTPGPTTVVPPTTSHPTPSVSGADWQGFPGTYAHCNAADDPAVFVGYTNRSHVVICQVGSNPSALYYRGYAGGGGIEVDVSSRSGSVFTMVNGNTTYRVSPTSLTISQTGSDPKVESMVESWVG